MLHRAPTARPRTHARGAAAAASGYPLPQTLQLFRQLNIIQPWLSAPSLHWSVPTNALQSAARSTQGSPHSRGGGDGGDGGRGGGAGGDGWELHSPHDSCEGCRLGRTWFVFHMTRAISSSGQWHWSAFLRQVVLCGLDALKLLVHSRASRCLQCTCLTPLTPLPYGSQMALALHTVKLAGLICIPSNL